MSLTLRQFLTQVSNKFFFVEFEKADGTITRRQACAHIPRSLLVGGARTTDPNEVIIFLDLQLAKQRKKQNLTKAELNPIRSFRWDRVKSLHFNHTVVSTENLK